MIRIGSLGIDVKSAQSALCSLGFYKGAIDGVFGIDTEAAVQAFQKSRMLTVDGVVGPATWNLLLSPDAHPVQTMPAAVAMWSAWLMKAQDINDPFPIEKALKWIELESGGQACAVGRVQGEHVMECGLSQVYFELPETVCYGFTSAQLRALCACVGVGQHGAPCSDQAKEAHARVAMLDMMAHRKRARAKLDAAGVTLDEKSFDFLAMVKTVHCLPGLFSFLRPSGAHDWGFFKQWIQSKTQAQLAAYDKGTARYCAAFPKVFANAESFAKG